VPHVRAVHVEISSFGDCPPRRGQQGAAGGMRGARLMAEDLSASPPKPQRQPEQQSTEQQGQNSENYELGRIHGKAMKRSEA